MSFWHHNSTLFSFSPEGGAGREGGTGNGIGLYVCTRIYVRWGERCGVFPFFPIYEGYCTIHAGNEDRDRSFEDSMFYYRNLNT